MQSDTLERELDGFLKWNPSTIKPAPNHTTSKKTRPPTSYDLHLHDDLTLKEIKSLPDLLTDLAQVVDDHIKSHRQAILKPDVGFGFPTYEERRTTPRKVALNEGSLVKIYGDTTARFSTLVASALIFDQPFSRTNQFLRWTTGTSHTKAIADGFLMLDHDNINELSSALSEPAKARIKLLSNWDLEELMIWEFKSLVAADLDKMEEIGKLTGPFNWIACGDGNHHCTDSNADGVRGSHCNVDGTWVKTGRKTGPDAKRTPWVLPNPVPKPQRGQKRKIDDERRRFENVDLDPHYIIQQMWAEAVRNDATIIVLQAGNLEYIGIRHRDTQTLFFSKLIHVDEYSNYGKLHTSLYISAFWDAVDRATQMETESHANFSPRYSRAYDGDPSESKKPKSKKLKAVAIESQQKNNECMLSQLQQSTVIKINSRLARRHFYVKKPLEVRRKYMKLRHNPTQLILTMKANLGDRVFRTSLEEEKKAIFAGNLVVKLAKFPEQQKSLEAEYHSCTALCKGHPSLGAVEYLGLYSHNPSFSRMSLKEINEFDRKLNTVLEFNPKAIKLNASRSPRPSSSPVSFYDKHLDASLVLKQVKAIPTLPTILDNVVEDSIRNFKAQGPPYSVNGFKETWNPPNPPSDPKDAYFVANYYRESIMDPCRSIAARFVLYPHTSTWLSALSWDSPRAVVMGRHHFGGEDYGLRFTRSADPPYIAMISPPLMEVLDGPTKALLHDLTAKFPDLATWEIYAASEEAESVMKSMDISNPFDWEAPRTVNPPHIPVASRRTPDANGMPWSSFLRPDIPEPATAKPPSNIPRLTFARNSKVTAAVCPAKSARVKLFRRAKQKPKEPIEAISRVTPPRRFQEGPKRCYVPDGNHFLQHAWAQAAIHDATFIVFHCGNFERIGIRDRESQTLHPSDVIDVVHCKDPAYGKIEVGVYIAVLQDAIRRHKAHGTEEEPLGGRRKRRHDSGSDSVERSLKRVKFEHDSGREKKRLVGDVDNEERKDSGKKGSKNGPKNSETISIAGGNDDHARRHIQLKIIMKETSRRNLVLLRLQYGVYSSPVPASFIRTGPVLSLNVPDLLENFKQPVRKRSGYSPKDYFTLQLGPEIGHGAVGNVHKGRLELECKGRILSHDVVAKIAFSRKQRKKLYHEFTIYQRLSEAGVEGVPRIFGFFEDMEGGASTLIMTDGGLVLPKREAARVKEGQKENRPGQITVTDVEKDAYVRVLENIHLAGVRHRDIRPWNLLITPSGEVCIIDFDRAELDPTDDDIKREHAALLKVMNAKYDEVHSWSTSSSEESFRTDPDSSEHESE